MLWLFLPAAIILAVWAIYALFPTIIYKYLLRPGSTNPDQSILLTFDDGPDPVYTPRLLAILSHYHIQAIFFLPAFKLERYPDIAAQIICAGHQIGFHGLRHRNPWLCGPRESRRDFAAGLTIFAEQGIEPRLYRPPHGNINLANLAAMRRAGLQLMLWQVIVRDWQNCGKEIIFSRLISGLDKGSLILLHDSGEDTGGEAGAPENMLAAVADFIPWALKNGYQFQSPIDEEDDEK